MRLAPLLLVLLSACGQEVVTPPCNDHDASTLPANDAAPNTDATATSLDATATQPDASARDDATVTALDAAACAPYCLTGLAASSTLANVREGVTLTPTIDNTTGVPLVFSVRPAELRSTRAMGRPPLVLSEVAISLIVDPSTGVVTFRLTDVPAWFIATTFHVRVYAKGPSGNDPEVFAEADVKIRGNLVFSGEYSDFARVYAVASDGRLPRPSMPTLTRGELITQLARDPAAVLMSKNGTLLVMDVGSTPQRVMRFELTGNDQQLSTFALADAGGTAYLDNSGSYTHSMVELPDGKVVALDHQFNRSPKSRLVLWNADGTYDRTLPAPDPATVWDGIGLHANGELLLTRFDAGGSVQRIDARTGDLLGVFADNLPNTPRAVLGLRSGVTYVSGDGYVLRIQGLQRSLVQALPGGSFAQWWCMVPLEGERILAISEERGDSNIPIVIEGRQFTGRFRAMGAGNISTQLFSLTYLE